MDWPPNVVWQGDVVLSAMRNRRGGPNWLIRGLALLVALLLAGPLSIYAFRMITAVLSYAL